MFKIEDAPRELSFGRQGEHGEQYQFDFSAWAAELPGGAAGVTVILPYSNDVVTLGAAQAVVDGTTLTVKIENNLTLTAGRGTIVIRYVVDGHEKRSRTIDFTVEESHAPSTGDAPEPVTDWVSAATAKLAEVDPALGLAADATLAANSAATLASEKAAIAAQAATDADNAHIVSADFVDDDIVLTTQGADEIILAGAATTLKGDTGNGIDSIDLTLGDHAPGTTDTYTITYTDATADTFTVYNGQDYQQDFPASWDEIRNLGRQGKIAKYFQGGDQFTVQSTPYTSIVFNLVDIGSSTSPNTVASDPNYYINFPNATPPVLHMHHVIYGRQFDNIEALYYCADGLAAGTYNFTLLAGYDEAYGGGLTYQFTLSNAVPAGGVIMFPWGSKVQASTIQISSYPTQISTSAIETVSVTAGNDGTALGTADGLTANMNHAQRIRFGSNNWNQSAVRQWLNSAAEANAWWTPQTIFDRPPSYANIAGFLNGLDPAFVAVLGETDHITVNNTVTDGGGAAETRSYVTRDKIYLPSRTEIYGTHENALAPEGAQYPYYADTVDADKIKYDLDAPTAARSWWVRSPIATNAHYARYVSSTTGAMYDYYASYGIGAAAACVIL